MDLQITVLLPLIYHSVGLVAATTSPLQGYLEGTCCVRAETDSSGDNAEVTLYLKAI